MTMANAASGISRLVLCCVMTSSTRNFDVNGSTNPATRFISISPNPIESDILCSATSSLASFHARVLSYLAIRINIAA